MAAWLDHIVDEYQKKDANYTGERSTEEEPIDQQDVGELIEEMEEPIGEL